MKICRFNRDHLAVFEDGALFDVSCALNILPSAKWPLPTGDLLLANFDAVVAEIKRVRPHARKLSLSDVSLDSPVANPGKIIAAPVNYLKHQQEALADGGKNFDKDVKTIDHYGLFLKANTSLVGCGSKVEVRHPDRRTDHELELVIVIGKQGRDIAEKDALQYVAGYSLGLDMTIRGPEDRSLRKSLDTFSVLGPWITTKDEVPHPNSLQMTLRVNDEIRQSASTADLIFKVEKLISYASRFYTLYPGDLIYTGTPEGVGPVVPCDVMHCSIEVIGEMDVVVA